MPVRVDGTVNVVAVLEPGLVKDDGALSIAVLAFNFEIDGKRQTFQGAINQALTDDSWNFVYLDFDGSLNINTTGFPSTTHIRLAKVKTSDGAIVAISDERVLLAAGIDNELAKNVDNSQTSTTDLVNWEQKLRLNLTGIPVGTYVVMWYVELRHSNNSASEYAEMRVEANDTTELGYSVWPYNIFEDSGGFTVVDLAAGDYFIDLDFRVQNGGTAYARRARLMFWRIA